MTKKKTMKARKNQGTLSYFLSQKVQISLKTYNTLRGRVSFS